MLPRLLKTALALAWLVVPLICPLVRAQNGGEAYLIARPGGTAAFAIYQSASLSQANPPIGFEVASIRPSTIQHDGGEGSFQSDFAYTSDGLTLSNVDISDMIQWAYRVQHFQVTGTHLSESQRYDVRAKAAEGTTMSALRLMLQSLLATRFGLRFHWEQKRTRVFELVVDRGGPKLPENKAAEHRASYPRNSLPRVAGEDFVFPNVTLPEFADELAELRGIDLPVVDRTGIQGIYDITLKTAARRILDSDEFSLPELIRKQLGLRLVPAKDPVPVLVIDHIEKPSPN